MVKTTNLEELNIEWTIRAPKASVRTRVTDDSFVEAASIVEKVDELMEASVYMSSKQEDSILHSFIQNIENEMPYLAFSIQPYAKPQDVQAKAFIISIMAW